MNKEVIKEAEAFLLAELTRALTIYVAKIQSQFDELTADLDVIVHPSKVIVDSRLCILDLKHVDTLNVRLILTNIPRIKIDDDE